MRRLLTALALLLAFASPALGASAYTSCLLVENPVPNDPAVRNTWGTIENTGRSLLDSAIAQHLSISVAGAANVPLTSTAGAADQSRAAHYTFTGVLTGNIIVFWPSYCRTFTVRNNTTGAFTITTAVNNGAGVPAGSTVVVPQGNTMGLWSDGTNILQQIVGLSIEQNQNAGSQVSISNSSAGNAAGASFNASISGAGTGAFSEVRLNNGTSTTELVQYGTGFTTSGVSRQGGTLLYSNGPGGLGIATGAPQAIFLYTNNTERMRIDASGNALLGNTTQISTERLQVNQTGTGSVSIAAVNSHAAPGASVLVDANFSASAPNNTTAEFFRGIDNVSVKYVVFSNGNVANANNSYGAISDIRLKQDIEPAPSQWRTVKALSDNAVLYRLKSDVAEQKGKAPVLLGGIAQRWREISPDLVSEDKDTYLTVNYAGAYMKALVALGEAQYRIETLEAKVEFLAARADRLEHSLIDQAAVRH